MKKKSPLLIALTGGIGSGKSAVAKLFKKNGITTIDADDIAHELVAPPSPYLDKLVAHFGQTILNTDGTLNRSLLRTKILQDKKEKTWLESLLHPPIYESLFTQAKASSSPYVILVIPLLLETFPHPKSLVDRVLVVDTHLENQISRVQARSHLPPSEINAIIHHQAAQAERLALADDIIQNNGSLDELRKQVDILHQKYLALSG